MLGRSMKELVKDGGRVVGAVAQDKAGDKKELRARVVEKRQ